MQNTRIIILDISQIGSFYDIVIGCLKMHDRRRVGIDALAECCDDIKIRLALSVSHGDIYCTNDYPVGQYLKSSEEYIKIGEEVLSKINDGFVNNLLNIGGPMLKVRSVGYEILKYIESRVIFKVTYDIQRVKTSVYGKHKKPVS